MLRPFFSFEYYTAIKICKKILIVKIVKYFPQTLMKIPNLHSSPRRHGRESRQNLILYFPLIYTCGNTISACKIHPSRHKTHSRACGIYKQSALTSLQYDMPTIKYIALSEEWHSLKHRTILEAMFWRVPEGDSPYLVVWYLVTRPPVYRGRVIPLCVVSQIVKRDGRIKDYKPAAPWVAKPIIYLQVLRLYTYITCFAH